MRISATRLAIQDTVHVLQINFPTQILSFYCGGDEIDIVLGFDELYFRKYSLTFRIKVLPPFSGQT